MHEWVALDLDLRDAYLDRLDLEREPPSADALHRLVHRHIERVPYETLWIHGGERWDIDPRHAVKRIAVGHRGGYCYHLNGALGALLTSLGYDVRPHVGGVHGPAGPSAESIGNHLVLTVHGLPSAENPSGDWYVDAGLGDALHDPLPLRAGAYDQAPFSLSLERTNPDGSHWHLTHDPTGGFTGMAWTSQEARLQDFAQQHRWLSTSPDSDFVQLALVERRDATGIDVLRGLVLSRIGAASTTHEPVTDRNQWFELLAEVFDLRFDASAPASRERLWDRVLTLHRQWEANDGRR